MAMTAWLWTLLSLQPASSSTKQRQRCMLWSEGWFRFLCFNYLNLTRPIMIFISSGVGQPGTDQQTQVLFVLKFEEEGRITRTAILILFPVDIKLDYWQPPDWLKSDMTIHTTQNSHPTHERCIDQWNSAWVFFVSSQFVICDSHSLCLRRFDLFPSNVQ